jgi:hypothetical protein
MGARIRPGAPRSGAGGAYPSGPGAPGTNHPADPPILADGGRLKKDLRDAVAADRCKQEGAPKIAKL